MYLPVSARLPVSRVCGIKGREGVGELQRERGRERKRARESGNDSGLSQSFSLSSIFILLWAKDVRVIV